MYTNIRRYNLLDDSGLQLNKLCCNIVLKPFSILIELTVGLLEYRLSSLLEDRGEKKYYKV